MAFSTKTAVKLHYILSHSTQRLDKQGLEQDHDQQVNFREPQRNLTICTPRHYVLIHGLFFGNLAAWYPLFTQSLSQQGEVLCYDLRGHGLSEAPLKGYRLEDHLNDLLDLLDEQGWSKHSICFIGHSFGARLALAALKARELISRTRHNQVNSEDHILLIDPPLLMANREDQEFFEKLKNTNIHELKAHLPHSLTLLLTKEGRRLRKMLKRWSYLLQETQFLEELEDLGDIDQQDVNLINRCGCVLFGSDSGCFRAYPFLKETLDAERIQIIEGGGHFLLNQSPQLVLKFIEESSSILNQQKG